MACVVLPSATARLVYGYLVKEKLDETASQFLKASKYLLDCKEIIEAGGNVDLDVLKLHSKDLHELMQEYSTVNNLVDKAIIELPKTSMLYINMKLNYESLPKKIDLILEYIKWSFKNQQIGGKTPSKQESQKDKNFQSSTDQISTISNSSSQIACGNKDNDEFNHHENSINESLSCTVSQENKADQNNIFNSNTSLEAAVKSILPAEPEDVNRTDNAVPVHENIDDSVMQDLDNNVEPEEKSSNENQNDLNQDGDQGLSENGMEVDTEDQYQEENQNEGNVEIVGIGSQNGGKSQVLDYYENSLKNNEVNISNGNITEDSRVVFLDSTDGNFKITPDPNQLIVISVPYYGDGAAFKSTTGDQNARQEEAVDNTNSNFQVENDYSFSVISEEPPPVITEPIPPITTSIKNPVVDSNIITANDFLNAKNPSEILPTVLPPAVREQLNFMTSGCKDRFRKILPKKKKVQETPAVVYVNVPSITSAPAQPSEAPLQPKLKENNNNKKRSSRNRSKTTKKPAANKNPSPVKRDMPNISSVTLSESPPKESPVEVVADKAEGSEEKENKEEKNETQSKIETPLVLTTRNTKRLSLSTPRRRSSHIRALEFETPPKLNDEKKKSQTSPKVKVDQVAVERKSVRNTLFKSPDPETVFKSPACLKSNDKVIEEVPEAEAEAEPEPEPEPEPVSEPLNELSIPIATRSPKVTQLSETWGNLTGVGCVLSKPEGNNAKAKAWDADIRSFIPMNKEEMEEKKRTRKPEKDGGNNKKPGKKKLASGKKCKTSPVVAASSKLSITAKRNTYSISENEEKSPVRPFQDDANLITPFKDPEPPAEESPLSKGRSVEETPITKFLREHWTETGLDIDLSIINTPTFALTPGIMEEGSGLPTGAKYFSPSKSESKNKITDYFKIDTSKAKETPVKESPVKEDLEDLKKKEMKETQDKLTEVISKAQKLAQAKPPQTGKILSMMKFSAIAQCDKKLYERIPIYEESSFETTTDKTLNENSLTTPDVQDISITPMEKPKISPDLNTELTEKRERTRGKLNNLKENLSTKNKLTKRCVRKRKRSGGDVQKVEKKSKLDVSADTTGEKLTESDESVKKDVMVHSTPYADRRRSRFDNSGSEKKTVATSILAVIPKFEDSMNVSEFPELPSIWRKKLYYVENFLKLPEICEFLITDYSGKDQADLKPDWIGAFDQFYPWARKLSSEVPVSDKTKKIASDYYVQFSKIKKILKRRCKRSNDGSSDEACRRKSNLDAIFKSYGSGDGEGKDCGKNETDRKKEEELEDGVVSTLPLKKRRANVQSTEKKENQMQEVPEDLSMTPSENVNQTQNFLQSLDLENVLKTIHNQSDT